MPDYGRSFFATDKSTLTKIIRRSFLGSPAFHTPAGKKLLIRHIFMEFPENLPFLGKAFPGFFFSRLIFMHSRDWPFPILMPSVTQPNFDIWIVTASRVWTKRSSEPESIKTNNHGFCPAGSCEHSKPDFCWRTLLQRARFPRECWNKLWEWGKQEI